MVGLFSVAHGIDSMIANTFNDIPGLVAMQPGAPIPLFSRLPADWGREIAAVPGVSTVNPEIWQRVNLIDGKTIISPPRFLFGIDIPTRRALKKSIYRDSLLREGPYAGRFLNDADCGTLNIVISRQIAEEFDKGVGDTIRVNGHDMPIVGVYHYGSLLVDVSIILDIDQLRSIARFDQNSVCAFYIEADENTENEELAERIRNVFRGRKTESRQATPSFDFGAGGSGNPLIEFFRRLDRGLKSRSPDAAPQPTENDDTVPPVTGDGDAPNSPPDNGTANHRPHPSPTGQPFAAIDDVSPTAQGGRPGTLNSADDASSENLPIDVQSASQMAEKFDEFASDLDFILGVLTAIGITIAVLSIVNTMLMSVTERIIEFGILKANGWSKLDVLKLITVESAILGLAGGILGSICGRLAADFINWNWPTRAHLYASPGLLAFGVFFATVLGIAGGLYPAVWAMRMMPMDAIRRG
jgi:putative ABC transport system permease protein